MLDKIEVVIFKVISSLAFSYLLQVSILASDLIKV